MTNGRSNCDNSGLTPNTGKPSVNAPSPQKHRGMLERFADMCDRLSVKEARQNKNLEPCSDSIGTRKALGKPFSDPLITADGSPRAHVEFTGLQTLWVNTGTLCNIECANCYIKSSPTNDALVYVTLEDIRPHFDDAKRMGAQEIGFTGGEPFLNPHAPQLIEAALNLNFSVLVLTNAMRPMMRTKVQEALLQLNRTHGSRLRLRVSLDHHTAEGHDTERGKGAFKTAITGLKWLYDNDFTVSIAGRSLGEENEEVALSCYSQTLQRNNIKLKSAPEDIVIFPEMDDTVPTPEISDACWSITGADPNEMMCASARMVVKRKGARTATILACTLITETPEFELGARLTDAIEPVSLNHPHCSRFCVLGGASCSGN